MESKDSTAVEIEIADAKAAIRKLEMLQRLQKNSDFKELIEKEYFITEASNVVIAKSIPHFRDEEKQKVFDNRIIGIGEFRQWLSEVYGQGEISKKALMEMENIRDEDDMIN